MLLSTVETDIGDKSGAFWNLAIGKSDYFGTWPIENGGSLPRHILIQVMHGSTPPGVWYSTGRTTLEKCPQMIAHSM